MTHVFRQALPFILITALVAFLALFLRHEPLGYVRAGTHFENSQQNFTQNSAKPNEFTPVVEALRELIKTAHAIKEKSGRFPLAASELPLSPWHEFVTHQKINAQYELRVLPYRGGRFEVEALAKQAARDSITEGLLYTKITVDQDFLVRIENRVYGRHENTPSRTPASAHDDVVSGHLEFEAL